MQPEIVVLLATAASIGLIHTLLGPDHYVPFVALAKARSWSRRKTLTVTLLCGVGHVLGSVVLGLLGVGLGWAAGSMVSLEAWRGEWAGWVLIAFGLVYAVWGVRRAVRNRTHAHAHAHADGTTHSHAHDHRGGHAHPHGEDGCTGLVPWTLFIVFVLGPCEPLIPLLIVPAAAHSLTGLVLVVSVFAVVTIATMIAVTFALLYGLRFVSFGPLQRWAHALAGVALLVSGSAVKWLGL